MRVRSTAATLYARITLDLCLSLNLRTDSRTVSLSFSHSSVSFTLLLAELSSHLHAWLKMLFSFHKMDR